MLVPIILSMVYYILLEDVSIHIFGNESNIKQNITESSTMYFNLIYRTYIAKKCLTITVLKHIKLYSSNIYKSEHVNQFTFSPF